jgi:AraC family transcriptional activator of pobA
VSAGDLFLIAPGQVHDVADIGEARGWAVEFSADAIGEPGSHTALLSWYANPLLYPFVGPAGEKQVHRFSVPEADQPEWSRHLKALGDELEARRVGHQEAARAHLTLILVEVARLAEDVVEGMHARNDPVLAEVFAYIEKHYAKPISLKEVAATVNLSPGHLTTVIRERTGRTVVGWIAERRMAEARRLLLETDESVENVGARVGYDDPTYFARRFRRAYGTTPAVWRRANR